MAKGQPDFGMYAATTKLAGMSDMAELAVRLGSIVRADRRGRVVWFDDFESAVLRWLGVGGNGGTAVLDSTEPNSGSQEVKLTSANQANSGVWLYKFFGGLPSDRLGAEVNFARPSTNMYLYSGIWKFNGTTRVKGMIRVDPNGQALAYMDSNENYQEFATGLWMYNYNFLYHNLKLVVDFDGGKYVRCIFNGTEYDLSSYSLQSSALVFQPCILGALVLGQRAQAEFSIYVDDYIFTQEEP